MNSYREEMLAFAKNVMEKLNEEFYECALETGMGFDFTIEASSHYIGIKILGTYTLWDTEEENDGEDQTEERIEKYVREQLAELVTAMQMFLPVVEMGLCEVSQVGLNPNQLYRFVEMPGCEKCKKLAAMSALGIPVKTAAPRSNAEKETTHEA